MTQVRFLRDWTTYGIGDVVEFDDDLATSLIRDGYCVQTETLPKRETR